MIVDVIICLVGAMLSALFIIIPTRNSSWLVIALTVLALVTSFYGSWHILSTLLKTF